MDDTIEHVTVFMRGIFILPVLFAVVIYYAIVVGIERAFGLDLISDDTRRRH